MPKVAVGNSDVEKEGVELDEPNLAGMRSTGVNIKGTQWQSSNAVSNMNPVRTRMIHQPSSFSHKMIRSKELKAN